MDKRKTNKASKVKNVWQALWESVFVQHGQEGWPFGAGIFFKILAHPVFKMWILQEPKKIALWNKRHTEVKKKRRMCSMFKIFSKYICWVNI